MSKLGSIEVRNTRDLIAPSTRCCGLIYAPPKFGKTELASGLNDITLKYRGKPTLFIACEAAEGGGTATLSSKGIDYVMPKDWSEMEQIIAQLATNESYGGIVLDNATDYNLRVVKTHALSFPAKEKALGARTVGVPVRSDYQVMGECARQQLNRLVNLTNQNTPERFRKDLIITALERSREDENGVLTAITPDLPGALANVVSAMFQEVASIGVKQRVVGGKRVFGRVLSVASDGIRIGGSRTGIFQDGFALTSDEGKPIGLLDMYELWMRRFERKENI